MSINTQISSSSYFCKIFTSCPSALSSYSLLVSSPPWKCTAPLSLALFLNLPPFEFTFHLLEDPPIERIQMWRPARLQPLTFFRTQAMPLLRIFPAVRSYKRFLLQNRGSRRCWTPAPSSCRTGPRYKQFSPTPCFVHRVDSKPPVFRQQ